MRNAIILSVALIASSVSANAGVIICNASTLRAVVIRPENQSVEFQNRGETITLGIVSSKQEYIETSPATWDTTYVLDQGGYSLVTSFKSGAETGSARLLREDGSERETYPTCTRSK